MPWLVSMVLGLGATAALSHPPTRALEPNHPTGHVVRPADLGWPPTPPGATDIRDYSDVSDESRRRLRRDQLFNDLEGRFARAPALRPLIGKRLTRLSIDEPADKDSVASSVRRFRYFDRQANATLTVTERLGGRVDVTSTPAAQYQPDITDEETHEAVALARAHFAAQGIARVNALQGFGIQAYKPTGTGFYDGRVIYVSFHVDSDSNPEYVALVDLTRQQIMSSRKEPRQ